MSPTTIPTSAPRVATLQATSAPLLSEKKGRFFERETGFEPATSSLGRTRARRCTSGKQASSATRARVPHELPHDLVHMTLTILMLVLVACGAAPDPTSKPAECPPGQRDAVSRVNGAHHCIIPADAINVTPGCEPQAVQAFYDWGTYGDGGTGAIGCAAAGQAVCADDQASFDYGMALATDAGIHCPFR